MHSDLTSALKVLRQGGVILYPTDTIWGLGCDATCEEAVKRIYQIKQREDTRSMLVLLADTTRLNEYVNDVPEIAWEIMKIAEKPLTVIYPGAKNLATSLVGSDGTIGIRLVKDEFCCRLIRDFGKPIVSTSANFSGHPWPANFSQIDMKLIQQVDYVVTWRQNENKKGKPSGIIRLGINGEVQVIRE
jgi:L-threonylcarbamoyladenylate synthase